MIWSITALAVLFTAALAGLLLIQRSLIYPAPAASPDDVPVGAGEVYLTTQDGLSLRAAHRPAAPDYPTLVFFHGNGSSLAGARAATNLLGAQGYGLLLVEYRGYGGNPGKPSETGLYLDGRAAIAWLESQRVGRERIVLIGNSLGSGTAVQLATEQPVAALIVISGFTSLADVVADHYPWLPARLLLLDRYDNQSKLARVPVPTLILHGTDDTLIDIRHAERLAVAAPKATLIRVRQAGHDLAYRPLSQAKIGEWLCGLRPLR